jgi:hypothetical protein
MLLSPRGPTRAFLLASLVAASLEAPRVEAADPTTAECLAASESSIQLRTDHKLRAAREQLLACSNAACPVDVRTDCARRVESVNAAIPTLVLEAKDAAGADVVSVKVSMDGAPWTERLDGTALSLDPGEHTFRLEAQGTPPVEKVLVIHEGEKDRRERIALAPPADAIPHAGAVDVMQDASTSDGKTQRIAAVASAGAGVLGAGLGIIFGVSASSNWSSAQSTCGKSCAPTSPAVGEQSTAQTDATISTVGFVLAGVGLAAGALLWFTAPHKKPPAAPLGLAPVVTPGGGGLAVQW